MEDVLAILVHNGLALSAQSGEPQQGSRRRVRPFLGMLTFARCRSIIARSLGSRRSVTKSVYTIDTSAKIYLRRCEILVTREQSLLN